MLGKPAALLLYGSLSILSGGLAWTLNGDPLLFAEPWLDLETPVAHAYSSLLGLTFGLFTVGASAKLVEHTAFGRRLAAELRPLASGLSGSDAILLAILSALGEELLFRSVLTPWLGVVGQALVFGVLHQVPGRSRFAYMAWATLMGIILGAIFSATGSLLGPIIAHALINALNLRFLKRHENLRNPGSLGGILGPPYPR